MDAPPEPTPEKLKNRILFEITGRSNDDFSLGPQFRVSTKKEYTFDSKDHLFSIQKTLYIQFKNSLVSIIWTVQFKDRPFFDFVTDHFKTISFSNSGPCTLRLPISRFRSRQLEIIPFLISGPSTFRSSTFRSLTFRPPTSGAIQFSTFHRLFTFSCYDLPF